MTNKVEPQNTSTWLFQVQLSCYYTGVVVCSESCSTARYHHIDWFCDLVSPG